MTYRFEKQKLTIIDPVIEIKTDGLSMYPSTMSIETNIILTTDRATFVLRLDNIKVENFNYDSGTLELRVMERLKDFEA